ncbi:ABC transporter ATP-binding protein [uncultured Mobiluncus sp.]|uniref:ABC transporter ATP-binding protein n=1 Tax=uncultured Mobiluncus sp. TaxID=293425 RepID=UPI00288BAF1C|nr:ABC transporter ATP-binding protein [uncultured Mobiluncus sp.]
MTLVARCDNVELWRNHTSILQGLNWQIHLGQHWVVLGPNGAGKTTLVDMLAGRIYPSRGRVEVLDEVLGKTEIAEIRQRVGYASPALAAQIPPQENVEKAVLSSIWGVTASWRESYEPVDVQRAQALMSMFEVADLKEREFATLSQGEKQRVLVARALMIDPEMLILDEPAAALDLGGRELLLSGLAELARDPKSPVMVMVTHHLEEIPPGFTHALALKEGRVFASGPLENVLTSETMSAMYGLDLDIAHTEQGRYTARMKL